MSNKEATARIKINKLLEAAGWRFFQEGDASANIRLEPGVTIKSTDLDALGANFEKSSKGFVDFLLLDAKGFPLLVLEAKAEDKNPLIGKEQARKYAKSQNCRFVILSNGNLHYFWDLERGSPYVITSFPTPDSVTGYQKVKPNPQRLIDEQVGTDYIVRTQRPNYATEAAWQNEAERSMIAGIRKNHDAEEREYSDAEDQIREVLIHGNYLSQKDIEICIGFNAESLSDRPGSEGIRELHAALVEKYKLEDATHG
jgi:type I site-specific restriction endonuclease